MKVVIQVVQNASVSVDDKLVNEINQGYLLLVGIEKEDTYEVLDKVANKIINLRINKDANDKTNLSILDINGQILSISQFTLCAILDGRRPSFSNAKNPIEAKEMYEYFNKKLNEKVEVVKGGIFGADMKVSLLNDGPFTILVDSTEL